MADISNREIKKAIADLQRGAGTGAAGGGANVIVTDGVPEGSANQGDIAYDNNDGQIYVFNNGSYAATVNKTFIYYAVNVDFSGESQENIQAGKVTSQGDVTGFSSLPFSAGGIQLNFRGVFYGPSASTDPTDYSWVGTQGRQGNQGSYQVRIYQDVEAKPNRPVGGDFVDQVVTPPPGWSNVYPDPIVDKIWESIAVVNPEANSSVVSEITSIVTNGVTGDTEPSEAITEQGFFDIAGVPGTDDLGAAQSATLNFAGNTGTFTNVPAVSAVTRLGLTGTKAGATLAGGVAAVSEETDITMSGVSGNDQIPAVSGVSSVWEMTLGEGTVSGNGDGTITWPSSGNQLRYFSFIGIETGITLRAYTQTDTTPDSTPLSAIASSNPASSTDYRFYVDAGATISLEQMRDHLVTQYSRNTNSFSSVTAKEETTDTLIITFVGGGNSKINTTASDDTMALTFTQTVVGSFAVGGDGAKASWTLDFGGTWMSSSTSSLDDYVYINASGVTSNFRFNGGWSGGGELAYGTGYTTSGAYSAAQVAAFFTEGLNTSAGWTEYSAVHVTGSTSVIVTRNVDLPSSFPVTRYLGENTVGRRRVTPSL